MEASTLRHASRGGLLGRRSPLLRLQGDERLVALIRAGHDRAFEVLFDRYHARLLAFCRHMLRSPEDAEDVLQEVFTNAHAAILNDNRHINVRPWLYRIARNRCLNQLRKPVPEGQDTMDVHPHEGGTTTAERVQKREDFRALVADVGGLPETQRTALLLREIEALAYDDIAAAMDTTVPAVKSLLVRARMSLAEATQARLLTCGDVQLELAEVAEGLRKASGPVRHHVRSCEACGEFRSKLRSNERALAALAPAALIVWLHKLLGGKLFGLGSSSIAGGSAAASGSAAAGGSAAACGGATIGGAAAAAGGAAGGIGGAICTKAAAGVATAALITAGAVEVRHLTKGDRAGGGAPPPAAVQGAPDPQGSVPIGAAATAEGSRKPREQRPQAQDEAELPPRDDSETRSPDESVPVSSPESSDEPAAREEKAEEQSSKPQRRSGKRGHRARGSHLGTSGPPWANPPCEEPPVDSDPADPADPADPEPDPPEDTAGDEGSQEDADSGAGGASPAPDESLGGSLPGV